MKKLLFTFCAALFAATMLFSFAVSAELLGDVNGDGAISSDDAVYLLRHTLFSSSYPVDGFADFNNDGDVTSDDAIYLLRHTLFPDDYPLIEYANGLEYAINEDGVTCTVTGIGLYEGKELNIPFKIEGYAVTRIGERAFCNNTGLVSVTIPAGVTSIGDGAFYNCIGLVSMTIPESITDIGGGAFENCYKLIEVCNRSSLDIAAGSSYNGYVAYYAKHVYKEKSSFLHKISDGCIFYEDN